MFLTIVILNQTCRYNSKHLIVECCIITAIQTNTNKMYIIYFSKVKRIGKTALSVKNK